MGYPHDYYSQIIRNELVRKLNKKV